LEYTNTVYRFESGHCLGQEEQFSRQVVQRDTYVYEDDREELGLSCQSESPKVFWNMQYTYVKKDFMMG